MQMLLWKTKEWSSLMQASVKRQSLCNHIFRSSVKRWTRWKDALWQTTRTFISTSFPKTVLALPSQRTVKKNSIKIRHTFPWTQPLKLIRGSAPTSLQPYVKKWGTCEPLTKKSWSCMMLALRNTLKLSVKSGQSTATWGTTWVSRASLRLPTA